MSKFWCFGSVSAFHCDSGKKSRAEWKIQRRIAGCPAAAAGTVPVSVTELLGSAQRLPSPGFLPSDSFCSLGLGPVGCSWALPSRTASGLSPVQFGSVRFGFWVGPTGSVRFIYCSIRPVRFGRLVRSRMTSLVQKSWFGSI